MTIAVIGATGHVGREIVRGAIARGDAVAALVRDADEGRRTFGEPDGLHLRPTRLDDPRDVTEALEGIRNVFIAMDQSGSRAFCSGSRSTSPPRSPRSSRSPASRC